MSTTPITATQLLTQRGDVLRRCSRDKEHFIVELHGVPIIAIIPVENYLRQYAPKRRKVAKSSQTTHKPVSHNKTVYEIPERARKVDNTLLLHVVEKANKVSQAGAALMRLKGIVKDPNLTDASTTIDDWVDGPISQEVDV